jgi:DNA primase small subunit
MYRHIKLSTSEELQKYLRKNAPAHCYHSSSYYMIPEADMSNKGWQGADLVFDIDSDHFHLPCQEIHDKWKCKNCSKEGAGHNPETCECGKAQFETETWLCPKCLQAAKYETHKLHDILIQDMGFTPQEITTNFSGNRGYHVHIRSSKIKKIDQRSRREIVDYIMATGLEPEYQGFSPRNRGSRSTLAETGWRGRAGRALYDFISECEPKTIKALKLSKKTTISLIEDKEKILETLIEKHPSHLLFFIDPKSLKILLEKAIKLQASEIDTVVTTDIHRLIRLPNTLHGKTGWQVQTIPYGALSEYDPLTSSITIKGSSVKLRFKWAPKIKINDIDYGPYENEVAHLPIEAALFFLGKKGAMITE